MKYQIGDTVRLKSAERLREIGWCKEKASLLGSRVVVIERIDYNRFYTHVKSKEIMLYEEDFDCLTSSIEEESYSLEELDRKICEFRKYLAEVNKRNSCSVDVCFYTIDSAIGTEFRVRK